jgi:hypothetical protein
LLTVIIPPYTNISEYLAGKITLNFNDAQPKELHRNKCASLKVGSFFFCALSSYGVVLVGAFRRVFLGFAYSPGPTYQSRWKAAPLLPFINFFRALTFRLSSTPNTNRKNL